MSLDGAYDPDNVFAKILRGELPCAKIFEDEIALAFLDLFPQSKGHALVVPSGVMARNFLDMPTEKLGAYMERVQRVGRGLVSALKPDGLIVTQFNGAPAGQTVFHLHFHLIPRYDGQALAGHGQAGKADATELTVTAQAIATHMKAN